ncbi:hypothetical protein ACFX13_042936 [Malus domestica]
MTHDTTMFLISAILNTIAHPAANPNDVADTGTATGFPHLLLAVEIYQVTKLLQQLVRCPSNASTVYSRVEIAVEGVEDETP